MQNCYSHSSYSFPGLLCASPTTFLAVSQISGMLLPPGSLDRLLLLSSNLSLDLCVAYSLAFSGSFQISLSIRSSLINLLKTISPPPPPHPQTLVVPVLLSCVICSTYCQLTSCLAIFPTRMWFPERKGFLYFFHCCISRHLQQFLVYRKSPINIS